MAVRQGPSGSGNPPTAGMSRTRTGDAGAISRRRFLGYLVAAPTIVAGSQLVAEPADAALPSPQISNSYDLNDFLTQAAAPTSGLIEVVIGSDGSASFALPRSENGQGITTAVAMVIADELGIALDRVTITLADARPDLVWNQLTGGSNSMHSLFTPLRVAAAIARDRLGAAAAALLGGLPSDYAVRGDQVIGSRGRRAPVGELAQRGAVAHTRRVATQLKASSQYRLIGTPQRRIDAYEAVTGRKVFAMDLEVPGALPTMVCRPPTINGSALAVRNLGAVKAMDGITDVAIIPHSQFVAGGVAVRGRTFGQCIDAIRALDVVWGPGPVDGLSDADVLAALHRAELPMTPAAPLAKSVEQRFTFYFRPGDPLETNCAVADVRADRAEIWSAMQSPIWTQERLATTLGLPVQSVVCHVTQGGGAFGRHLFSDAAFEAAAISRAIGKPVKLMWHRTDNFRQGRVHPMCTSRVRITYSGRTVLAFDQRHTSVATDFTHGLGELITANAALLPFGDQGYSQTYFTLTQNVPYQFGPVSQLLYEILAPGDFNTSSVRNVYSPDIGTATELMVDVLAARIGLDPYRFRRAFAADGRMLAVLDRAASAGRWGRAMPAGTAQGIAIHSEYKGRAACVAEIDCRPQTVNRRVRDAYTGPRVTRVTYVVDTGLPINPLGLQAQMIGGIMDGIAQALTYSLHLRDGHFLEGSWDNAYYTREWNVPPEVEVIVMPPSTGEPGGAGEFGVAASMAAVACAYARATGTLPTSFPINHDRPLGFTPFPTIPPIPQSPTNGLSEAF
jgi:isoquinoline 1-oxidoreductase beta subunit